MAAMTLRYPQLVGMTVVSADGRIVGRVRDLVAERHGDALAVTTLLVGPAALLQRIAFRWIGRSHSIPWQLVAQIDDQLHLRVPKDEVVSRRGPQIARDVEAVR